NANATNRDGQSVLLHATRKRHLPMMEALLARGADANAMDNWGFTPLYLIVSGWVEEHRAEAIQVLVNHGADINQRAGIFGRSALHTAALGDSLEFVHFLLARGADLSLTERFLGNTPLMNAAGAGNVAMVEALLAAGAAVDRRGKHGSTALMSAAG